MRPTPPSDRRRRLRRDSLPLAAVRKPPASRPAPLALERMPTAVAPSLTACDRAPTAVAPESRTPPPAAALATARLPTAVLKVPSALAPAPQAASVASAVEPRAGSKRTPPPRSVPQTAPPAACAGVVVATVPMEARPSVPTANAQLVSSAKRRRTNTLRNATPNATRTQRLLRERSVAPLSNRSFQSNAYP